MRWLRFILGGLLLLTAAIVLLHRPRGVAAVEPGVTRIQYWEKWTGEEGRQMRMIVDAFNETVGKEKRIFVEYTSMSTIDQKTLVATAAGVPPDIAGIWDSQLVQFAAMDALEPLDDLARAAGFTEETYKPVYWNTCVYQGKLWGLISTPATILLHYNKAIFEARADALRAKGLDPNAVPKTIDELDRYAEALTTYEPGSKRIRSAGHLPLEPGWYIAEFPNWFGSTVFDQATQELRLTDPGAVAAFDWIASYSKTFGKDSISDFRSGLGGFASAQNPFLTGSVAMEQQGPWMVNYIEDLAPAMNRWHVPAEKLQRERDFARLMQGMTFDAVVGILGQPPNHDGATATWDAGIKTITCTFSGSNTLETMQMELLPAMQRRQFCQWGVAPFPSAVPGKTDMAYCPADMLVIPRGSKHKAEAFEFIKYVNRQDVSERLNMLHCTDSPLRKVSRHFIDQHPNAYIEAFESAANSPNSFGVTKVPIWPEVAAELEVAAQQSYLLEMAPRDALAAASSRLRERWDRFQTVQAARAKNGGHE